VRAELPQQMSRTCATLHPGTSILPHLQSLDLSSGRHVSMPVSVQLPGHEPKAARFLNLLFCFISEWRVWRALTWLHTTGEQLRAC
jgi:hypothetical protein